MIKVELPTKENLKALKLSQEFSNFILNERDKIGELKYWCEEPVVDWPFHIPDDVVKAVCLWSRNGDIEVCWERVSGEIEFVSVYHDDPEYSFIGSEFHIKTDLLVHLIEAADWHNEDEVLTRLDEISEKVGYSKFRELNDFHQNIAPGRSFDSQLAEFKLKWQSHNN